MKIDFKNGSSIKIIDTKEQPKRLSGRTMTVYPITLDYVKKHYCKNCVDWHGSNRDYGCKNCETCMERIKWRHLCFGEN